MGKHKEIARNNSILTKGEYEIVSRLEKYDISFVFEKLLVDKKISSKDIPLLEREFKRFIALAGFGVAPLAMISPLLDEIWHQFILFTNQYKRFCHDTVGRFIGHQPDTNMTPIPIIAGENLRSSYNKYFGSIPDIWYEGMDATTKNYYVGAKLIGKPPRAWSGWTGSDDDENI
jgi:hypothetical protein